MDDHHTMYTELFCCDKDASNDDVRESLFFAMKKKLNGLVVSHNAIQDIKELAQGIDIICPIDYPLGNMDGAIRQHAAVAAGKKGAHALNVVASNFYIANRQFTKLHDDLKAMYSICHDFNMVLRVMIDYRIMSNEDLLYIADIIHMANIDIIYPSTHSIPDDIADSLILANVISTHSKLSVMINPNIWSKLQYEKISHSGVYGVQFRNIATAKTIFGV